jgi:hypothetical protein
MYELLKSKFIGKNTNFKKWTFFSRHPYELRLLKRGPPGGKTKKNRDRIDEFDVELLNTTLYRIYHDIIIKS